MSGEIRNAGGKGKAIGMVFTAFLLFIILWAYVYYKNGQMTFPM